MRSLTVHVAASAEAEAAASWYEKQRVGLGSEFRDQLVATLNILREGIVSGAPWPGALGNCGVRRLSTKRFPFYVVFTVNGATVFIAAIAHHAKRPQYWSRRLGT